MLRDKDRDGGQPGSRQSDDDPRPVGPIDRRGPVMLPRALGGVSPRNRAASQAPTPNAINPAPARSGPGPSLRPVASRISEPKP